MKDALLLVFANKQDLDGGAFCPLFSIIYDDGLEKEYTLTDEQP